MLLLYLEVVKGRRERGNTAYAVKIDTNIKFAILIITFTLCFIFKLYFSFIPYIYFVE